MASRRRRRARSQKRSRGKLGKWLGWSVGTLVLIALVALVLGYRAVRGYLRGDDFRVLLTEETGDLLASEVEIDPLEWDGWKTRIKGIRVQDTNAVQIIEGLDLEAEVNISAVWDGKYHIKDVRLRQLEVSADLTRPRGEAPPRRERQKSFWSDYLPEEYEVSRIEIANVLGQIEMKDGMWSWEESSAVVTPGQGAGVYDFELNRGSIKTPLSLIPSAELIQARGRYADEMIYLLGAEVNALERARVTLEGDYSMASKDWKLRGKLVGARCEEVVEEDWKQRLLGGVTSDFRIKGGSEKEPVLRGHLQIDQGVLTALPVLDRIAAYANTVRFRRLALSEAELDFRKEGDLLELTNIRLASEGLVRMEGQMTIAGNVIRRGQFRVGITPGTLAHLPGAESKVFQRGERGLLWSPLRISGTLDSPKEDLSDRLIAAARERMFEVIPGTGKMALKYSGQVIGDSVKKLLENSEVAGSVVKGGVEVTKGAVETGGDVVREGVGTLFDLFGRPAKEEKEEE